jgi:ABC-type glycerol-3-phosphate transport system substrate-binding protein
MKSELNEKREGSIMSKLSRRLGGPLVAALVASVSVSALAAELGPANTDPVYFRGWQFRTDVVQSNVDRYNKELGGHVDYQTVTGDYPSIMESNLIAGGNLDLIYGNPSSAFRYNKGGWIVTADELPAGADALADMYPNIKEAWSDNGKLLGLSYFVTTRGLVQVNLKKYGEAGLKDADFPATWHALYDQLYVLRDKGVKVPYLPHWYNEWSGIPWAFTFEVLNRGGQVADAKTHAPALTADGPGGDTLRDWKRVFNDGLVPKDVITWNQAAYLQAWGSGQYAFSPQAAYDLKTFNDPATSQIAGSVTFLPYKGQSWGLLDSALYLTVKRNRSPEALENVKRFASWYGFHDQNGVAGVAERWLDEAMLFSAYKSVMESDHAKQAIQKGLSRPDDYKALLDLYAATPYPTGSWNVVWSEEFNSWLKDELQQFLSEDRNVNATIDKINAKIAALNKENGL